MLPSLPKVARSAPEHGQRDELIERAAEFQDAR